MAISKSGKLVTIYVFFVIITIFTMLSPVLYFLGYKTAWKIYSMLYFFSILIYLWFRLILLAYNDFKEEKWGPNYYTPFTVLVPCYNEDPKLFEKSIESVINAKGEKKIIIIDDGSENNVLETIKKLVKKYDNIKAYAFKENKGKRKALYEAFKRIDTKYIVTIDSDTIVDRNAFVFLIAPLVEKEIGATTGNIELLNEKRNLLTRTIAGMYLSGLNNYKKPQSVLGNVICCSGCLSAYKMQVVKEIAEDFLNQKFLGKIAKHSEDRHLTNLILERGHGVVYVESSLCFTESPYTLGKFLKQQQRWKRGYVRETIYLLSHSWKTSKTLFFEALIGNALPFFLSFGIQIHILFLIFLNPSHLIRFLIPGWILFMTIREMPIFIEHPIKSFWYYFYIPLYELFLWWQNILAIFTVNNKGWLTR